MDPTTVVGGVLAKALNAEANPEYIKHRRRLDAKMNYSQELNNESTMQNQTLQILEIGNHSTFTSYNFYLR